MEGRIFAESSNIYQDEAKVLFNFYKQSAERIVKEEERIEKEIARLEEEKSMIEKKMSSLWIWFLTIILFFMYFVKKNALTKELNDKEIRINEFKKQHKEIFREYKVSKLGVAYVPVAEQIKYEDKSFVVDYTGQVGESEVTLQLSRQNDLLIKTIAELDQLSKEAPIVETSDESEQIETDDYSLSIQQVTEHDYMGKLERSLRTVSFCMDDLDKVSVSLPLVADNSDFLKFLDEYGTMDIPEGFPVIEVFNKEYYADSIRKFQDLNSLKDSLSNKTQQFEDVLKGLMMSMANSVQAISAMKLASTDKIVLESNKILYQILKSPYNHYSPILEYEEIERIRQEKFDYSDSVDGYVPFNLKQSSRVKLNPITGMWIAEDGSVTNSPFGVHQIYEEIVAPVVQSLMEENRIERMKIYNHIKDQKISYLNKWHQDTDAFYRANRQESADIINLMQESLREYVAAYNTLISLQKTENSMESEGSLDSAVVKVEDNTAETVTAFEMQSKEFQEVQSNFEEYMERLKEDIDLRAEQFSYVEYFDAELRDSYSRDAAVAASEVHDLDERRRSLAEANPLLARNMDLPPVPKVEDITYEHISLNLPAMAKNALEELEPEFVPAHNENAYNEEETGIDELEEELEEEVSVEGTDELEETEELEETDNSEPDSEEEEEMENGEAEHEENSDEESHPQE